MSEKDGKLFKANSTDRWPSRVHNMTSSFEKECADARSLLDQLAKYLLNRSYNSSSDSFMKKMRELNVATFTVMEFNKTLEKLIPNENKFNPDGSDSESLYSCYDQPSMKSFTVNQWINKNDKCSQESSSKPTEQEVDQEQDHRDSTPESDLKKAAGMCINQIADVGEASVKIDNSEESVASNDLAVKNQNEMPVIFKCRPMGELMARDSESIPETDSDSADSSKHSESTPDDHFAGNSASEDKVELHIPPQIPLEMNKHVDCLVTHVESPSRFYVVSRAAKSSLDILIKGAEFDKSSHYSTKCELSYKICYACFYDRTWSRVQLINLLKNDVDDVEVFFIDTGRKEYVKYYNLTPLHEELYSLPAVAYLCHLFKVTPLTTSNGVWTFAALKYMKNKVQGFPGKITPTEFINDSYGVLLSMNDNKLTTINLTMIIKNLAHDLNDTPVRPVSPKTPSKDQLTSAHVNVPPTQILKDEYIECVVTHVESPSSFYVTHTEDDGMPAKLKSYYQEYKPTFKNSSECTQPFYACLHEDVWWRALVVDASSAADELTMFFLDSGLKTNINVSHVRPLAVEFCNVAPKAFLCHLFRVEPLKENGGWTNKAIRFMKKKTLNKKGRLFVENTLQTKFEASNGVILIVDSITLNVILVVKNLAQEPDEVSTEPESNIELMSPNLNQSNTSLSIHEVPAEAAQIAAESPVKIKSVASISPQNNHSTPPSLTNVSTDPSMSYNNFNSIIPTSPINNVSTMTSKDTPNISVPPKHSPKILAPPANSSNDSVKPMYSPKNSVPLMYSPNFSVQQKYSPKMSVPPTHSPNMSVPPPMYSPHISPYISVPPPYSPNSSVPRIHFYNNMSTLPPMFSPKNNIDRMQPKLSPHNNVAGESSMHSPNTSVSPMFSPNISLNKAPCEPKSPNNNLSPYKTSSTLPHSHEDGKVKQISPHQNVQMVPSDLPHDNDCTKMRSMSLPNNNLSPYKTSSTLLHSHEDGKVKQISPHQNVQMVPSDLPHDNDCTKMRPMSLPNNNLSPYKTSSTLLHSHEDGKVKQISPHQNVQMVPSDLPHDNDCTKMRPMSLPNNNLSPYKTSSTLPHSHEDGKVKQISSHHNVQMVPSYLPYNNDCAKMRPMSLPNNNLSPYKTSSILPHSHEDGKVKQISSHHNVQMVPSDLSHDNDCAKMRPMSLPNNNLSPYKTSSTLPHSHEDGKVKQISSHHNVQMVPSDLSHDNDCAKVRPMSLPNNNLSPYKTSSTLPHSRHEDGKVKQISSHHNVQMVPSDLSHNNDCAKMRPMSLPNNNFSPYKTSSTLPHSHHEDGKVKQISPHHNVQMVPSDLPHDNDCAKMHPMSLPNNNFSPYKTSSTLPYSHHEDGKVKQISPHHNVQMVPSDLPHDNDCAKMRPMSLPNNNVGSGTSMQHLVNDVRKENSMVPNNKESSMQHLVKNVNWRTSIYHPVNDVSRESPIVPNNNSDIVMSNNAFQSVTTSLYERSNSIINPVVSDCGDLEVVQLVQLKPLHNINTSNNISKKKSMLPPNKNINAMSSVPKDDDVDSVKHNVISTEINNLTAELTNKPSISAFMPKSSYSKVSTVPSLLPHFCNVGASPLRLTLDSNSKVPSKMSLCDVNVPSLMSTVCNWPTLGSSRRNEVNRHQFMGQVLDLDLPASRVTKKKRGFVSKYTTSETSIKNNSPPSLKDNKNIKGRAITKTTNNKIKSINTLEAAFQGICLESHTKGKTSVTSSPKKTNVKPRPELNSVTSNLGKTNVTSSVLVKNNVTPSETTLVAKSARVVNVPVDDVDYSILDQPMGSELENLNLSRAAQGFTANDEAEVCAHYKGPPDTTCFKGASCKKKHILLHRDGWTVKQISAIVDTKNELKLPPSDSLITVSMTQVETCCSFYGHILDSNSTSGSQLLCDDPNGMPEPLQKLLKMMNGEAALKELKPYSTLEDLPGLGELVAALFPMDGLWYRARVLEADSEEVEVLYVDFGNRACLRYEQIARLLPLFGELPVQAVRFVLGNVQIPADPTKALTAAQAFFELTQNKRLCALVLSVEVDDLHIILYDSNADDVGIIMASMDLVETKDYRVINYGDRILSEDAIRLNKTVRCVEQNKKDVILHGVQFNGLFPG